MHPGNYQDVGTRKLFQQDPKNQKQSETKSMITFLQIKDSPYHFKLFQHHCKNNQW